MTEKRFKLKLCSNGHYYVWFGNDLITDEKGNYISFDAFNKESAEMLVNQLNRIFIILDKKAKETDEYVFNSVRDARRELLEDLKKELMQYD